MRTVLAAFLLMSSLVASPDWTIAAETPFRLTDEQSALLEKRADQLTELKAVIDRQSFDREALLEALDFDVERIVRFVSEEIQYQPYAGLLRGPDGTLQSRAGNMLDQAVLLAALIKSTGYDARVAYAPIGQNAAPVAPSARQSAAAEPPLFIDPKQAQKLTDPISRNLPAPAQARHAFQAGTQFLQRVNDSIYEAAVESKEPETPAYKPETLFWVDYRSSSHDSWISLNPVNARDMTGVPATGFLHQTVDPALQQRVRIEVLAESSLNGKLSRHSLITPWEQAAANLIGEDRSVTLQLLPDAFLMAGESDNPIDRLPATVSFVPMINGGLAPGGKIIDRLGIVADASVAFSQGAGLFRTIADRLGKAVATVDSDGGKVNEHDRPVQHISRVWLKITASAPASEPIVIERDLARWQADWPAMVDDLSRQVTLSFQTGETSPAAYLDQVLTASSDLLIDINRLAGSDRTKAQAATQAAAATSGFVASLNGTRLIADTDIALHAHGIAHLVYRHRPAIIAEYSSLVQDGRSQSGIDIMTDPRRSYSGRLTKDVLLAGLISSVSEARLFGADAGRKGSAAVPLLDGLSDGAHWITVAQANDPVLEILQPAVKAVATAALARGDQLLFREHHLKKGTAPVWWRLSRSSGELVATLPNGWGGETVESLGSYIKGIAAIKGAKTYGVALTCTSMYGAVKVDQALSFLGPPGKDPMNNLLSISPCVVLLDPGLKSACEIAMYAVSAAADIAGVIAPAASFQIFVRACIGALLL